MQCPRCFGGNLTTKKIREVERFVTNLWGKAHRIFVPQLIYKCDSCGYEVKVEEG